MTSLRMTSDLRRQLIWGSQALLRPQWFCRHHDAKRRGCGGHFRGVAVQAFSVQGRAVCRKSWPRNARPIRIWRVCWAGTVDRGAGATDQDMVRYFVESRAPDEQEHSGCA